MPASSIGALNSWGMYLVASASLMLLFAPMLTHATASSRIAADWRNLDGVRSVLDGLISGMTVELRFGTLNSGDDVVFGTHQISCNYGQGTLVFPVHWQLPGMTLHPGVTYAVTLEAGKVSVTGLV